MRVVFREDVAYNVSMLWLVGNSSKEFDSYAAEHGIEFKRFTAVPESADSGSSLYVDMHSTESVAESLMRVQPQQEVSALFVAGYEHYVLPAAWIADYFKVKGCRISGAMNATDKALMRQAFMAADPDITPQFSLVHTWQDVEDFMATHSFPVMLKPANLMKSLFITKNDAIEELRANFNYMQEQLPATYQKYRLGEPRILIEECMSGSMHTVAGFVDDRGEPQLINAVVDCVTAHDVGINDSYLFSRRLPSNLSTDKEAEILRVAVIGCKALGLTNCPVHVELMYTDDGPKIIEIGARLGGYRSRMYGQACGIDLYGAALDIAYGKQPDVQADMSRAISIVELFPKEEGSFSGAVDESLLRKLLSFKHIAWKYNSGDRIGSAAHGYRATAIITLLHDNAAQVLQDEQWLLQNLVIPLRD